MSDKASQEATKGDLISAQVWFQAVNGLCLAEFKQWPSGQMGGQIFPHISVAKACGSPCSVVTQWSSPQTAAENRTTFLSLCVFVLTNKPIMHKKFDNT